MQDQVFVINYYRILEEVNQKLPEEIIVTIREVSGHTYDTLYDLVFTDQRIIAVLIQNPGDVVIPLPWYGLFIGNWGAKEKEKKDLQEIASSRRRKSRKMSPDQLIDGDPNNFYMKYDEITSVELKRSLLVSQYKLKITVNIGGKRVRKFTLQKDQAKEARQILARVLPLKCKI